MNCVPNRELYLNLLKECLLDNIHGKQMNMGYHGDIREKATKAQIDQGLYWPDRAHTMIGRHRLNNIQFCIEYCLENDIPGDLIETGVWRGGAVIFMKGVLEAHGIKDRKVFVADSFEGCPEPEPERYPHDIKSHGRRYNFYQISILSISKEEVEDNFRRYNLLDENVVFVEGFFEHSLHLVDSSNIAVLRLDGDMYSSTIQVLNQLYDRVPKGGFIIIDDWKVQGAFMAVRDFRAKREIQDKIKKIDKMSAFWQKS